MKILKMLFFVLFFLASDVPVLKFEETSTAQAEEFMQLARLNRHRSFLRRVSSGSRLRSKIRGSKNQRLVRKVFSSPRGSRTRQNGELVSHRFIPRKPVVAPLVKPNRGALSESHAVLNSLHTQQNRIRSQFSTDKRRRLD